MTDPSAKDSDWAAKCAAFETVVARALRALRPYAEAHDEWNGYAPSHVEAAEEYERDAARLLRECVTFAASVRRLEPPRPKTTTELVSEEGRVKRFRLNGWTPPVTEHVPDRLRKLALDYLPLLALLASGDRVPRSLLARAHAIADVLESIERRSLLPWQEGLIFAFESFAAGTPVEGYPVGPRADINAVYFVTDEAARFVGYEPLPDIMHMRLLRPKLPRKETDKKLQSAIATLRTMKLAGPGERAGGRAKKVSAFTAARDFAHALGLPFPDRERDARRVTKSGRRVSARASGPSRG